MQMVLRHGVRAKSFTLLVWCDPSLVLPVTSSGMFYILNLGLLLVLKTQWWTFSAHYKKNPKS